MTRGGAIAAAACLAAATVAAQAPGAVSGVVLDARDGRPLAGAAVTLTGTDSTATTVLTDDEGRFAVAALSPGRYRAVASKPGYVTGEYGSRHPELPGVPLRIRAGASIAGARLFLPRAGAISGVVRAASGDVASGVDVRAILADRPGDPDATAGVARTDATGRYRIGGLPPGSYVAVAIPELAGRGAIAAPTPDQIDQALNELRRGQRDPASADAGASVRQVTYVPSFFPATARALDAAPVTVEGDERSAVDITIVTVETGSISGRIIVAPGMTVPALDLELIPSEPTVAPAPHMRPLLSRPDAGGRFSYRNVPFGQYRVRAIARRPLSGSPRETGVLLWAEAAVTVTAASVTLPDLRLQPPLSLAGRIVLRQRAGSPAPPFEAIRVVLRGVPGSATRIVREVRAGADGTFELEGLLPGEYLLGADPPAPWAVESATLQGRDVLDTAIELPPHAAPVVMTLVDRLTILAGTLQGAEGTAAEDYALVAFPADPAQWRPGSRRIQLTRPDTGGQFVFVGLPAGRYLLGALSAATRPALDDPSVLRLLSEVAVPVVLRSDEDQVRDLRIVGR